MGSEIKTNPITREEWIAWLNRIKSGELEPADCASVVIDLIEGHEAQAKRLHNLIWSPHVEEFLEAVRIEAAHQRDRWGEDHDQGKTDGDWMFLLGYLAAKVTRPGVSQEKRLHHIVTSAAVAMNWHRLAKEKPIA